MTACVIIGMTGLGSYYHISNKRADEGILIHGTEGYRYSL